MNNIVRLAYLNIGKRFYLRSNNGFAEFKYLYSNEWGRVENPTFIFLKYITGITKKGINSVKSSPF